MSLLDDLNDGVGSLDREIEALVPRFAQFQKTLGLSDRSFVAKFPEMKSDKSWKLIRDGKWKGHLNPQEVISRLRALERRIDSTTAFDETAFCEALPFVKTANREFTRLLSSDKDRRGLIMLASEGVGKSWWASRIVSEDPTRRFYVHLASTWKEKPLHILRGIAERIGAPIEINPAAAQRSVVDKLNEINDPVLIIDEGHNGGIALWRLCKDLIATTKVRVVLMAFPTQFDLIKMSSVNAVAEARQFLRRCQRPILDDYRAGIKEEDVEAFLVHAAGFSKGSEVKAFATQMVATIRRHGNVSLMADALSEAQAEAEMRNQALSLAIFAAALRSLCGISTETKEDR